MKLRNIVLVLAAMFMIYACGTSVESQQKTWESNKSAVEGLKAEYPAFKTVLDEKLKKAQVIMDEAQGLSDEDAKIKKMQEANAVFNKGFIGDLKKVKTESAKIDQKIAEIDKLKIDGSIKTDPANTIRMAKESKRKAEDMLKTSTVSNEAQANTIAANALTEINNAVKNLDGIIGQAKNIKDDQQKAQEDQQKAKEDSIKKAEDAKKPIECEYCGTMNEPTATKCKSCGASISKK